MKLWNKNPPDRRMKDRERLLRFFALLHLRDRYRVPFRAFLNDEMVANIQLSSESEDKYVEEFELAAKWLETVFGREAFYPFRLGDADNPPGRWVRRRYDLLYEVEMVGFAEFGGRLNEVWVGLQDSERALFVLALRRRFLDVMTNHRFAETLNEGTTRPRVVRARFEMWNHALETSLRDPNGAIAGIRGVHAKLSASSICDICPRQLTEDDAVWMTDGQQRKLAHRYCARNQQ